VSSGIGPVYGAVDPSGKFLFFTTMGHDDDISPRIYRFLIDSDGTLSPNGTAAILPSRSFPTAIAIARHPLVESMTPALPFALSNR
jgi:hypothetical protein